MCFPSLEATVSRSGIGRARLGVFLTAVIQRECVRLCRPQHAATFLTGQVVTPAGWRYGRNAPNMHKSREESRQKKFRAPDTKMLVTSGTSGRFFQMKVGQKWLLEPPGRKCCGSIAEQLKVPAVLFSATTGESVIAIQVWKLRNKDSSICKWYFTGFSLWSQTAGLDTCAYAAAWSKNTSGTHTWPKWDGKNGG